MRPFVLAPILLVAASGSALAHVCIKNATEERLFLAADTMTERRTGWREPGGEVCADGEGPATVSAFRSEDDFEGCSRRTQGSGTAIRAFQGVDLCRWSR